MRSTRRPLELQDGLIWVDTLLTSAGGAAVLERFVLDTGTSNTILSVELAEELGYPASTGAGVATFDTPDGPVLGYTVRLPGLVVLGRAVPNLLVGVKTFHSRLHVAGILGLDFLRGTDLLLSFRKSSLHLAW